MLSEELTTVEELTEAELKQGLSEMCFYKQPIYEVAGGDQDPKLMGYELLLRKTGGENRFPAMLFKDYMSSSLGNQIFCKWLVQSVAEIAKNNPDDEFGFNVDPQQLLYDNTYEELKALLPYRDQIMIEITEGVPARRRFSKYYNYSLVEAIKQIHELGFSVAVDDVSSGMNSLNAVREYLQYVDRLKLSLIQFRSADPVILKVTVDLWQTLSEKHELEMIVEGIDSQATSDKLINRGLTKHQGYLYSKPIEI
jgi:EAL domain-containing protein (putative c-di-GMP-specific phosphodiesterase class I)